MKRRSLLLAALAVVLVLGACIGIASAYFTTYAWAKGSLTIELGDNTEIFEEFSQWTKHVVVANQAGSSPVFVRARAFWGDTYSVVYDGGADWVDGSDGFWYYQNILYGGGETSALDIRIVDLPSDMEAGDSFNVVVIYETTPVLYDESGAPYADWSIKLYTETSGGDGG